MPECDVLIVGASCGGTAAALAASASGAEVWLLEETHWVGGQLTAQGVCTPDENAWIETFGPTRRYAAFRQAARSHYLTGYQLSEKGRSAHPFHPGNCWVSRLAYEPKAGEALLREMLRPFLEAGNLHLVTGAKVTACTLSSGGRRVEEVTARTANGPELRIRPQYVLDATDTGELLALCGKEGRDWITGAEGSSDTGEPDAPEQPRPRWVQPFTFPFALEWSPETASENGIPFPEDYEELKTIQNYAIKYGSITGLFEGKAPWWTYRRVLAAENFDDVRIPHDVAMINTPGNDFYGGNVIGEAAGSQEEVLTKGRRAALGYLCWLQNECPREDGSGRKGYPEFRLRTDFFDTPDGCSVQPYIRESRRIRALRTVKEQEIVVQDFSGNECLGSRARAAFMPDSTGVGHYWLDIHPNGHGEPNAFVSTRPFQIPLGALVARSWDNLLPACKNLGVTHLTNGAYRLHPIEWNIGESAALLALHCIEQRLTPREIYESVPQTRALQERLLQEGITLHWYTDVPPEHSAFLAVQRAAGRGAFLEEGQESLLFVPDAPLTEESWSRWRAALGLPSARMPEGHTRAEGLIKLFPAD